jgi:imidazolonepropionase-like amidohydrolase
MFLIALDISAETIAINNATIWDGESENSYQANILISKNKIIKISKEPQDAKLIIDGTNKIVTPGFIAPNTEIGIVEIGALSVTRDDSSNYYKLGFSVYEAFNPKSTLIPWNRSNGITSSLTLPAFSSLPIGGMGSFFVLDGSLEVDGIRDIAMIGKIGGSNYSSRSEQIMMIEGIFETVSYLNQSDINSFKKLDQFIDSSSIASSLELKPQDIIAIDKVLNKKIPLILKVDRSSDILKIIKLKNTYKINIVLLSAKESWMVAEQLSLSDIPVIVDPLDNIPNSFDALGVSDNMPSILEKNNINIMFSAPRDHNYHLIRQAAGNAVANGLSYATAIKGLTSNVSDAFNIEKRGRIKENFYADLIVWESDPLEPSSFPLHVIINGENHDLTSRSTRLRDRYIKDLEKPNTYRD